MMSASSSDSDPYDSGVTGKGCELPSSPGPHSDSDLSGDGRKDRGGGDQGLSTGGEGSSTSVVMVAQPPHGSGKEAGLREIALTGSEALDVLDQVGLFV